MVRKQRKGEEGNRAGATFEVREESTMKEMCVNEKMYKVIKLLGHGKTSGVVPSLRKIKIGISCLAGTWTVNVQFQCYFALTQIPLIDFFHS